MDGVLAASENVSVCLVSVSVAVAVNTKLPTAVNKSIFLLLGRLLKVGAVPEFI